MKFLLPILVCLLVVNLVSGQSSISPVTVNGKLKVENNLIVNKSGNPPQLRGVSFSWSLWQGKKYYNPGVVDWLTDDFKVSLIRASMGVQPDHGYLSEPKIQKQLIISVIDQAIKDGIYVLIDWHDHHGNLHMRESADFFAQMAKRYTGVPNVIYEVWNEPEVIGWDTVKNYAIKIITEIRKYDTDNLIIVGSPHWDQDVDIAAEHPIIGFKNVAYSFHFYASDPNHQDKLRAKADFAIEKGLPLIVTEWGVGESDGNGKFDEKEVQTWAQWLEKNKLSWANWNITDKEETTAILLPGAPATGGWTVNQLSPAGKYVRTLLKTLNK